MDICWNQKECFDMMLQGANGLLWGKLEDSGHFRVLEYLLYQTEFGSLLDIGCGAGGLSKTEVIKKFSYIGLDSEPIITNVAKKFNPSANFQSLTIEKESNLSMVEEFDVVVMNAFLDVLIEPLQIMYKVLNHCKKYVIIHRQFLKDGETQITTHDSYGAKTFQSNINSKEFYDVIESCKMNIIISCYSGLGVNDNFSFLLKRENK